MSARDLPISDDLPQTELQALAAGSNTRIHPSAHVDLGAGLGKVCTVRSGAALPRRTPPGDRVTVGPNAVFVEADVGGRACTVGAEARIDAGAVIYPGVRIDATAAAWPRRDSVGALNHCGDVQAQEIA